jgi:hypothetical protein
VDELAQQRALRAALVLRAAQELQQRGAQQPRTRARTRVSVRGGAQQPARKA